MAAPPIIVIADPEPVQTPAPDRPNHYRPLTLRVPGVIRRGAPYGLIGTACILQALLPLISWPMGWAPDISCMWMTVIAIHLPDRTTFRCAALAGLGKGLIAGIPPHPEVAAFLLAAMLIMRARQHLFLCGLFGYWGTVCCSVAVVSFVRIGWLISNGADPAITASILPPILAAIFWAPLLAIPAGWVAEWAGRHHPWSF